MRTYVLDPASPTPLYEQLYRCIKEDLLAGVIAGGEKLPSKRALAENLNVSRITVESAYQQLLTEGYLQSRPRSGYYAEVLETLPQPSAPRCPAAAPVSEAPPPSAGQFPFSVWARLMRGVLLDCRERLLAPMPGQGLPELRAAIAGMLRRSRGMAVDPETGQGLRPGEPGPPEAPAGLRRRRRPGPAGGDGRERRHGAGPHRLGGRRPPHLAGAPVPHRSGHAHCPAAAADGLAEQQPRPVPDRGRL